MQPPQKQRVGEAANRGPKGIVRRGGRPLSRPRPSDRFRATGGAPDLRASYWRSAAKAAEAPQPAATASTRARTP